RREGQRCGDDGGAAAALGGPADREHDSSSLRVDDPARGTCRRKPASPTVPPVTGERPLRTRVELPRGTAIGGRRRLLVASSAEESPPAARSPIDLGARCGFWLKSSSTCSRGNPKLPTRVQQ